MNSIIHKTAILTIATLLFVSCEDVIDIFPVENNITSAFYTSEIEVKQAITGVYARLGRNGSNTDFPTEYYWLASENRSDILYLGGGETSAQNDQLDLRKYLAASTTGVVSTIFSRLYMVIKEANNLLFNTGENEYVRYRAEACFLRAYAYSELVRAFGPVALVTYPIENREAITLPRAPIREIYDQVIKDLEYASENLDNFYTGDDAGRVGSVAASALLGQVYMTMAGYPLYDAGAYAKAETVLGSIIADVDARFAPDYSQLFILENENKYDLFSIQFASGISGTAGIGSSLPGYITNSGSGASPFPEWTYSSYGQQGQDLRADTILVNEMKAVNDLRLEASIDTGYWNSLDVSKRTWVERNIVTKFLEKDNTNARIKAWNDFPRNFTVLRVADVYLLYAEALVQNGKAGMAKQYVDKIRIRAGLTALNSEPTLDDIKYERKCEFIGEGKRYFDIVRWGEDGAVKILNDFTSHYHSNSNGQAPTRRDLLLPIPRNELKTRTNWEQNFGY